MANQRIRLSTRFLTLFKIMTYGLVGMVSVAIPWAIMGEDWNALVALLNLAVIIFFAVRAIKRFRTVTWEKKHLVVKHRLDEIIIVPEEIKNIELKTLIGVHEVTLYEPHPYLGESFLFLASMNYIFKHGKIDDQMHELRQHIAQSKRTLVHTESNH